MKNIFVLGLDDLNLETLRGMPGHGEYRFHRLLAVEEVLESEQISMPDLLAKAQANVAAFDGRVDAIIGYWDFPVSSMVPILCARFGLIGPSLEAVLKCEHKYWSRLEQSKVIDGYPRFALVDLDRTREPPSGVGYPFWLKPVKSASSALAFRVESRDDFQQAMRAIRADIGRMGEPFDFVLDLVDLPPEIADAGGQACLAEEAVHGQQVTVEGYSTGENVRVYGIVDSISYAESPSFLRFQYPSTVPSRVSERLTDISGCVIEHIGLRSTTFNIEFFWNRHDNILHLLEINPRHSQSHARLFEQVDGVPNHQALVMLALGREPKLPDGEGDYAVAAKWFVRHFDDGVVRRAPTAAETARVEQEIPGTTVHVVANEGDRLSEIPGQDSYSYELAHVYVGAHDEDELKAKYERCVEAMPFEIAEET